MPQQLIFTCKRQHDSSTSTLGLCSQIRFEVFGQRLVYHFVQTSAALVPLGISDNLKGSVKVMRHGQSHL